MIDVWLESLDPSKSHLSQAAFTGFALQEAVVFVNRSLRIRLHGTGPGGLGALRFLPSLGMLETLPDQKCFEEFLLSYLVELHPSRMSRGE